VYVEAFKGLQTGGIVGGLWNSRKFADVKLLTAQGEVRCHASVLAMVSPVFDRMLSTDFSEGRTSTIDMKEVSQDDVSSFLKYLYTGDPYDYVADSSFGDDQDVRSWLTLLDLADMYEVPCLAHVCAEHLTDMVDATNVCDISGQLHLHSEACPGMSELLKRFRARVQEDDDLFCTLCSGLTKPPRLIRDAAKAREDKLQKVIQEGRSRGVEIEGTADIARLRMICTSVELPEGDLELLVESVKAMNTKLGPVVGERTASIGHLGKMVFSARPDQLAIVAYVPEEMEQELNGEEWLGKVLERWNGTFKTKGKEITTGLVKLDEGRGCLPSNITKVMIQEAYTFLRRKGLLPEEDPERPRKMQRNQ